MITPKGYIRNYDAASGRLRMEHDVVWERANGPIPPGFDVHHVNDVKTDNRLENLLLLDKLTHKRIHGGCELRVDGWWKPCRKCGVMKHVDTDYYPVGARRFILSQCKICQIADSIKSKRRRRLERLAA